VYDTTVAAIVEVDQTPLSSGALRKVELMAGHVSLGADPWRSRIVVEMSCHVVSASGDGGT
jgi:hypothetical protein